MRSRLLWKAAGGILTAGSDAPVETNNPQPFINISRAITRAYPGQRDEIAGTRVLETWFQGRKVYTAADTPPR